MINSTFYLIDVSNFYPIEGILRDSLLLMEALIILLSGELALILRIRETKFRRKYNTRGGEGVFSLLFISLSVLRLIKLISDFFILDFSLRVRLMSLGFIIPTLGVLSFLFFMERRIFDKVRPFTLILIILIIISFIVWFYIPYIAQLISIFFWIPILFTYFPYLKKMRKIFSVKKNSVKIFATGFILIAIGYFGSLDFVLIILNNFIGRYISNIISLVGLIFIAHFFLSISTFLEYDWKGNVKKIIIYYGNGITIFDYDFDRKNKEFDKEEKELSVNTALFGIQDFLKNTISKSTTKPIENFELDIGYVMIEYGKNITAIAICKKRLMAIRILLNKLVDHIEKVYSEVLPSWKGDLNKLKSIESIFKSVFYLFDDS